MAKVKLELDQAAKKLLRIMWNMDIPCGQTKDWFLNRPRPSLAFEILRLPRPICSQIIHFETGHNFLRRHKAIIMLDQHEGLVEEDEFHEAMDPIATCSLCGQGKETSFHISFFS